MRNLTNLGHPLSRGRVKMQQQEKAQQALELAKKQNKPVLILLKNR